MKLREIVMPNAVLRTIVLGGLLAAGTSQAAETAVVAEPPTGVLRRIEHNLNQAPTLPRHMVNECLLAGTAAMAIAAISTGPIAPAVSASLGVTPGLSVFAIGGLACGAGAAAAMAAGVWTAWSERSAIAEAAEAQVVALLNAVGSQQQRTGEPPTEQAGGVTDSVVRFLAAVLPTGWHIREVP